MPIITVGMGKGRAVEQKRELVRCLAILQPTEDTGRLTFRAQSDGLAPAEITIATQQRKSTLAQASSRSRDHAPIAFRDRSSAARASRCAFSRSIS